MDARRAKSDGTCGSSASSSAIRSCWSRPRASSPRGCNRIRSSPDFRTIVLDEFHERSVHADLGHRACAKQAWLARDDLRLVVMSATLDASSVAAYLADCPVVDGARDAPSDRRAVRAGRFDRPTPSTRVFATRPGMFSAFCQARLRLRVPAVSCLIHGAAWRVHDLRLSSCTARWILHAQDKAIEPADRAPRDSRDEHRGDLADGAWCHRR